MLMPEMSYRRGNYMSEFTALGKLFKFQGWSAKVLIYYLESKLLFRRLGNPLPNLPVGTSAAYSTLILGPT